MPQNEARAWWADVEHVRESIERRRDDAAQAGAPGERASARRFTRAVAPAEPPVPRLDDLDWPPDVPGRGTRRFEHSARADRADRGASTREEARVSRRHAPVATDADRGPARGRRPRGEAESPRTRSRRADDAQATVARGTHTPTSAVEGAGDPTTVRRSLALDFDFERAPATAARRTVQITGRTVAAPSLPRLVEVERRRPGRRPAERVGPRPDRIALYAVLLGFFLILVAATSSHAAI